MNTFERLTQVFQTVFKDDTISLTPGTTTNDIEGWDSLSHVNLLIAIELEFNFEFKPAEIQNLNNVGDLIAIINKKLNVR
jgi:acyl carrier protein